MDLISYIPPELIRMIIAAALLIGLVFVNAIVMGYLERKICARIQRRPGPMEVGWQGWLQLIVDGIKIIGKQLIVPRDVDKRLFRIAPLLSFTPVVLPFIVIPFSEKLQARDFNLGLLFILAVASINVMSILMAGWASNNKYSLFGAMRSVAQNIAYEIPILLSLLSVIMITNTYSLKGIVEAQSNWWFMFLQPVAFIIYMISGLAETNRAPFDLPEAESELTAGFHTEYSGFGFSLFVIAEYANMFIVCSLATILFLGGWHGFPLGFLFGWEGFTLPYVEWTAAIWFFLKVYILMIIMIWVRWTYPRVRFDQLMTFAWKYLIPFALANLLITAIIVKII